MPNVISKLNEAVDTWSFKYNCYEAVHPWTPFCSDCALDVAITVFTEAIKLYTPLYLFPQFVKRKFDTQSFAKTGQSIIRSTSFISANAFFALLFFCSSKYLTGKFYYYAVAYIPAFIGSAMAVLIEKPSRRSSLAFYVSNVASETLFKIFVARGFVRPISHGQVYLFSVAIATIMYLARKHGFEDDPLSATISLIVGPEEAAKRTKKVNISDQEFSEKIPITSDESVKGSISNFIFGHHYLCPHPNSSCLYYALRAASRALLIGYTAQLGMRIFARLPLIWKDSEQLRPILRDTTPIKFGLFLCSFSGLYKSLSCIMRWRTNCWTPKTNLIAALAAGPAMFLYPSSTVALYVLWKSLEALFHEAERSKRMSNEQKELLIVLLYALATSQLFYSALMNPKHMKKSYMSFLDRMSQHRLHLINRSVLDVFGTEASAGYEDYFPDLHPSYMSRDFLGSIWIWMIEQKFVKDKDSAQLFSMRN